MFQKSYNLSDLDEHGPVYFDAELGSVSISPDLTKIAYVAEQKESKKEPFCKTKNGKDRDEEEVIRV